MRIYGNREIKTLSGQLTRPTLAKVREALFNIWQWQIEGCRWLDLCAGSGSMGAEALCRGAKEVIAIEQNSKACQVIRENWSKVAKEDQKFRILKGNVLRRLAGLRGETFDYIYFDPPYQSKLYEPVLEVIATYQLLSIDGEIAVEHDPKQWGGNAIAPLTICRQKQYGNTQLTFYQ
ncbi:MAG: 16S rRNA (guanine(966)-N(2))-methyltransferase RsmD [Microcystaceae cyanobacterium]